MGAVDRGQSSLGIGVFGGVLVARVLSLQGSRVLLAGLIGSGLGAAVEEMLQSVVTHTPVEVSPRTFALFFGIFFGFGAFAGLTLETVRQLQASNSDPAYHQKVSRGGGSRKAPDRLVVPVIVPARANAPADMDRAPGVRQPGTHS